MKKLLIGLLFLAAPVQAICPRFQSADTNTQQEIYGICHDLQYPQIATGTAQNFTIINGTATQLSGVQLNFTTGTINSFMVVGTATNDNAPVGRIGEYVESVVGNTNFAATGQWADATSISLSAGVWDITLVYGWTNNPAVTTFINYGVSTTSGNSSTGLTIGTNRIEYTIANGLGEGGGSIANYRQKLASTTTYYAKHLAIFSAGTPRTEGLRLSATRVR
jgi:hypothetical protein